MKKRKILKRILFTVFVMLMIVLLLVVADFRNKVTTPYKAYGESVIIQVKKGASVSSVGKLLFREKVIADYNYFRVYLRFFHKDAVFKSGEYQFDSPMTMKQVIEKIVQGKVLLYKVTIKEGLIIKEVGRLLEKQRGISYEEFVQSAQRASLIKGLDPSAPDLEGYLFPDTYFIRRDTNAKEMVELMVTKFKAHFTDNMKWRAKQLGLPIRDIITIATLIEKETASREERFLISSVFHNRLRIGMPMGCDPTIIYALKRDDIYRGKLGWAELKYDSPYNTRLHKGLPPGPICSPGYASIEAALYPENTKYLYFVAKNYKSHYFSKNLKEHNWAVRKFIINRKR
ncbi:MAG: endolytic transglycosylase MltG [bacterium]|nr:endolytic transglycosylase MltG [bacterium]